jgi:hypothetical protein
VSRKPLQFIWLVGISVTTLAAVVTVLDALTAAIVAGRI